MAIVGIRKAVLLAIGSQSLVESSAIPLIQNYFRYAMTSSTKCCVDRLNRQPEAEVQIRLEKVVMNKLSASIGGSWRVLKVRAGQLSS